MSSIIKSGIFLIVGYTVFTNAPEQYQNEAIQFVNGPGREFAINTGYAIIESIKTMLDHQN